MTPQNQLQSKTQSASAIRTLVETPAYQGRLKELLKDRTASFVTSLIQLVTSTSQLQSCEPNTVLAAALTAAALDLPIEKNLGFAHIVPYKGQASFQLGYKGFVQLAIRSGQYRFINACVIHKGELVKYNKLTGEVVIDPDKKINDDVVGYAAFFQLITGYEHAEYWTKAEVEAHAQRFSQAYRSGYDTPWKSDFDSMALKTVLKDLISHWGIMSVDIQLAVKNDQSVRPSIESDEVQYVDNPVVPEPKQPVFMGGPQSTLAPPTHTSVTTIQAESPKPAPASIPTVAAPSQAATAPAGAGSLSDEPSPFEDEGMSGQPEIPELITLRAFMEKQGVTEENLIAHLHSKMKGAIPPTCKTLAEVSKLPDGKGARKINGILNALTGEGSTVLTEVKAMK